MVAERIEIGSGRAVTYSPRHWSTGALERWSPGQAFPLVRLCGSAPGWASNDDLVLTVAIALWRAHGDSQHMMGMLDYYRGTAGPQHSERYTFGVELGQSHDPTAIAIVRRITRRAPATVT